jgi:DNA-directed RNA polymerase subunit M/transcription elongation factor TFIIS
VPKIEYKLILYMSYIAMADSGSLLFPNSVPLASYFYENQNYNDIRRAKLMMFGDSLNKYEKFSKKFITEQNEFLKYLERGCYSLTRRRCIKKGFGMSWDDDDFVNLYHDVCYKLVSNIDGDEPGEMPYLANQLLNGVVKPLEASALSSQDMAPEKYIDVLNRIRLMNEEVKIKTSKLYTCSRCKKKETVLSQVQDRSNDENSSLIALCVNCGFQWRMAG